MGRASTPTRYGVVSGPQATDDFTLGVHQLAALIRPTYGTSSRYVANAHPSGRSAPELLFDGATVARRVTELEGHVTNVGAMYLRGLMEQVHATAGDGASTGALVFEAMYSLGRKAVASGHDPVRLRQYLLDSIEPILGHLARQRIAIRDVHDIRRLALSAGGDPALAGEVARVYGALGSISNVDIRPSRTDQPGHELIDAPYWPTRPLDPSPLRATLGMRVELANCAIFVSDLDLETMADAVAILNAASQRGVGGVLVFARSFAQQCQQVLRANSTPARPVFVMATPGSSPTEQSESLSDIAVLSGGNAFHRAAGALTRRLHASDLGFCRRAWVSRTHTGLISGSGKCDDLRSHVTHLRTRFAEATDVEEQDRARTRLARITGRSAVLWVDGSTDREIDLRKERAQRTCRTVQRGLAGGILPGGGLALYDCRRSIAQGTVDSVDPEARMVHGILDYGLGAPIRSLARNAGIDPAIASFHLDEEGGKAAFDVTSGHVVPATELPVLDSFDAVSTAVRTAIAGVAQALTLDTVVLRRLPPLATTP